MANFEAMTIAFEPSAFNDPDATRVNIVFRPTSDVIDALTQLDEWIVQTVCKDNMKYFGKQRSLDQICEPYPSSLERTVPMLGLSRARCSHEPKTTIKYII